MARLWFAFRTRPLSVSIPMMLIPVGLVATVLGPRVSRAMTVLGGAGVAHLMGILMLLGGALVAVGIARADSLTEMFGLACCAGGCAIYSVGVLLGLGLNGAVTGPIFLAITIGFLGRVMVLATLARGLHQPEA